MASPNSKLLLRSQKLTVGVLAAMLFLLGFTLFFVYQRQSTAVQVINYSELYLLAESKGSATSVLVEPDGFAVTRTDGSLVRATVNNLNAQQALVEVFRKNNAPVEFSPSTPGAMATALSWIIPVGTLLLMAIIGWRVYAGANGRVGKLNFVQSSGKQSVTFNDVAGVDEAKAELAETIEFLRDPMRFGKLGGRAPRGILLSGHPGTGKTLLARAAASEAGVPFLSVSGSSFQEKFAGVGAARVRRLFAQARKLTPCVIFIDEIDALGRHRGRSNDSASSDQDQTLNQLLIEMDGFDQTSSIVVIGSTNRPDVLDSALTRPGRFDREVTVNLPDVRGREAILRVHAKGIHLEPELELTWIARGTPGFSGAELANLLNEAAIAAARENASAVGRGHIEMARDRILMGAERQGFMMDDEERFATAVHEAGHVAVGLLVENGDPIHKVSILPRGRALGVTQSLPERDRLMKKREYLEDQIALLLGGRAAEQILLATMTAGASNDIERAVEIARRMVSEFGMSPLGPIHLGGSDTPHSQMLLDRVEEATNAIIEEQLGRACDIVRSKQQEIDRLVGLLMERDTLDAEEIFYCFNNSEAEAA
ncbi:MAG TPA: ATP-dependent zinc metalloprotease FtsH [Pyrinomonadaceae bacterium]|nr:ATP-dependent zinc metalloprotease FtsH [Pyrinomonadaceae bacterium]